MSTMQSLYKWFYGKCSAEVAAVFRIATGTLVFLHILYICKYIQPFFTDTGYLSHTVAQQLSWAPKFSLLFFVGTPWVVYLLFVVMSVSCLLYIVGIYSQWMSLLTYVLFISFFNRFPVSSYAGTHLCTVALFFGAFLQSDRAFTPQWYRLRNPTLSSVPGWPLRMIQLQLCVIYLIAAISKVQSYTWWNGTELLYVLNSHHSIFNFTWLQWHPNFVAIGSYFAMFAELLFPILIWYPSLRRTCLIMISLLHIGIALTMHVTYFSETMLALLTSFLLTEDLTWVRNIRKSLPSRGRVNKNRMLNMISLK